MHILVVRGNAKKKMVGEVIKEHENFSYIEKNVNKFKNFIARNINKLKKAGKIMDNCAILRYAHNYIHACFIAVKFFSTAVPIPV